MRAACAESIASTWTIHQCASVVDVAYHITCRGRPRCSHGIERRFRDVHAIAQQIHARDTQFEDAGKTILAGNLGAPPTAR
ncbi:hypothetical protein [Bradyrhizobium sp. CCBAU 51753]|uniref:hypothetical protein n=1 Tax=Bradyrhizobium sp. CCBAU 51753 TaxID=1325100 RepID=UPI00188C1FB5